MTPDTIIGLMAETIKITLLVAAPMLIVGLVVGVLISLFQAVTQIQEMTLVFVPKIVAVLITLIAALPWMMGMMITYTQNLFINIPLYIK
ncbi:MAG: flagellar biosynthetic protein FliQ [Deltaproteobacteria bacterium HGW-Deltaproteobacteria-7]|jgi:flagellar biosynthetic protein FliQ|nr:MAG: flagellar biosynthetic protein FliQ [Deltaproteobacteria bacterium HGW-Deltaproteobacteria-7]PKN20784.1 MAG: flagellar biosynthetic protein FliQ [Deltaproteobacteria bacterium HGW-Deltaproteobacteria-6]